MVKFIPYIEHKKYKLKDFILKPSGRECPTYVLHLFFQNTIVGYVDKSAPTTSKNEGAIKYFCVKNGYHQIIGKITLEYKKKHKRWSLKKAEINCSNRDLLTTRTVLIEKKLSKNVHRL